MELPPNALGEGELGRHVVGHERRVARRLVSALRPFVHARRPIVIKKSHKPPGRVS
jgi:hypothetical protein